MKSEIRISKSKTNPNEKAGFPVTLDQLDRSYALPAGSENPTTLYMEAFSNLHLTETNSPHLPLEVSVASVAFHL